MGRFRAGLFSGVWVLVLFVAVFGVVLNVSSAGGSGTIYIRADGSIDPPTAPISTVDNVTYTLAGNISSDADGIVVERSNIIIDGNGCTLLGNGIGGSKGIYLSDVGNVTIKKANIKNFWCGIWLYRSSYNNLSSNTITNNFTVTNNCHGISLSYSSNNVLRGNIITNNENGMSLEFSSYNILGENNIKNSANGILFWESSHNSIFRSNIIHSNWAGVNLQKSYYNSVSGNNITNNEKGVFICWWSNNNTISGNSIIDNSYGTHIEISSENNILAGNHIAHNSYGVYITEVLNNVVYHNNFIGNTYQAYVYGKVSWYTNIWDNDYPSGGNYWSDYNGTDIFIGPYQNITGSDGIGDSPYVIDASNQDRYPLMHPWSPLPVHNINTGLGYSAIQEAINANETLDGHTIFVEAGTYYESVVINKSILLIGESRDNTIIDAEGVGTVVNVEVDNVAIKEFTLTNSSSSFPSYGIYVGGRSNVTIQNNNVVNNLFGIWLEYSSNNSISGNNITANSYDGIRLHFSLNNSVSGNIVTANNNVGIMLLTHSNSNNIAGNNITNNYCGIALYYSSTNTLRRNIMTNNKYNFGVGGSGQDFVNDVDVSNTVDGKPVYYWINKQDVTVPLDAGYVALVNCTGITVQNLNITKSSEGIILAATTNSTIIKNNITNTGTGIVLWYSSNNSIHGNIIETNGYGIALYYLSDFNSISENTIAHNRLVGIRLERSSSNRIYHNNFIDNADQVYSDGSVNVWDDGYPSGGNYWSDYSERYPDAEELDGSGLWDTPYVIDANNQDRYPLMYPYGTQTYKLTITTTSGGTTTPSPGTHTYVNGTIVWVMALPDLGYSFDHWRLEGVDRLVNPIIILMAADGTLEAFFVDDTPPDIGEPLQDPPEDVEPHQPVTVTVSVTDLGTGVYNVTLWYSIDNGTIWTPRNMTEISLGTYQTTIPGYEYCTWVSYKIVAYDNAGNNATKADNGYGYKYHVIPEFPSAIILPLFLTSTLLVAISSKRKQKPKSKTL